MILSKKIISFPFFISFCLYITTVYAQDNKVMPASKKTADSLLLANYANLPVFSEITTIPDNSNAVAAANIASASTSTNTPIAHILPIAKPTSKLPTKLYNTWNNKDIKVNSDKTFNKNTTYILPLINNEADRKFVFPYKGKVISPFGYRGRRIHAGTDIKLNLNDEVYAAFDGEVRMAKRYSGYGNLIVIRHPNGLETCYGHLNKMKVKINQQVKAGDLIGLGGRTGRASTTHLHFETRFLGDAFNSAKLLDYDNFALRSDTLVIDRNTFIKSKNFKYKKNKRGKRVKVYFEDPSSEENTPVNTNTTIVYQEEVDENGIATIEEKPLGNVDSIYSNVDVAIANKINKKTAVKEAKTIKAVNEKKLKKEKPGFYKVRKGDTLSKIARNNGTSVKDLCKINKIDENAILSLGSKIKLK